MKHIKRRLLSIISFACFLIYCLVNSETVLSLLQNVFVDVVELRSSLGWVFGLVSTLLYVKKNLIDYRLIRKMRQTFGDSLFLNALKKTCEGIQLYGYEPYLYKVRHASKDNIDLEMMSAANRIRAILHPEIEQEEEREHTQFKENWRNKRRATKEIKKYLEIMNKEADIYYMTQELAFNSIIKRSAIRKKKLEAYDAVRREAARMKLLPNDM